MNKCYLIGNLTRDPEFTTTASGISMCRFAIAVSRRFKNAEGENETDFFNVVAWRGLADNCSKFLKKGLKVAVIGAIQNRSYDAEDGTKRYTTDIVAEEVEFLTPKGASGDEVRKSGEDIGDLRPVDDDTLPF